MLTVKLKNTKTGRTVIVEAPAVQVLVREGGGKVITCDRTDSMVHDDYQVFTGGEYDVAYVENARGATLEIVRGS